MSPGKQYGFWKLVGASCLAIASSIAIGDGAIAQIVPDRTLPNNSTVTDSGNTSAIEGGTQAGSNLFHSFESFSLPTGNSTYFNNAADITNIFSRVTGRSASNIDGLIRANGSANLFLLNPNGIIFGRNASLNIGGSFLGSTANSLNFADGTSFSATAPTTPLLTISVPTGLQFGQNPGRIEVQGTGYDLSVPVTLFSPVIRGSNSTGLRVPQGKTLALVGGDVDIEGGVLTAEQGHIELGSVGSDGQVSFSHIPPGFTFNYQGVQRFGDIRLSQQALADASGGGSIQVQGLRVSLTGGSLVLIQNQGVQRGGSISVNAAQSFEISGVNPEPMLSGGLSSETVGDGNGADIALKTRQLVMQDGAGISTISRSPGKGGNINVNAADSVQLSGFSPINPTYATSITALAFSLGDAGDIKVSTRLLTGLNGGQIASTTLGTGRGGDVTVDALDSIELIGQTSLSFPSNLNAATSNTGDAGNVTVNTSRLAIRDGGNINSATLATGNAGSVTINARESVEVSGRGSGNPSAVSSSAPILPQTFQAAYRVPPVPSGDSGDISINTPKLSVTDSARVAVNNEGIGNAGTLRVNASSIFLDNQGGITAATVTGEGGNIFLEVQNLLLRNNSAVTATAGGTGNGGNINIDTDFLAAFENSDISANSANFRGGNVTINATGIFGIGLRDRPTPLSDITATGANSALSGNVQLNIEQVEINRGLIELPAQVVDTSGLIASGCRAATEGSSFTVTGRGGLPPTPQQELDDDPAWRDRRLVRIRELGVGSRESGKRAEGQRSQPRAGVPPVERTGVGRGAEEQQLSTVNRQQSTSNYQLPTTNYQPVVEATGWAIAPGGEVMLTAAAPDDVLQKALRQPSNCNGR